MSEGRKRVNYDLIEPGWRAGIKTPGQLAAEYTEATGEPVTRVAICKHFEKAKIPRDLKAKIQAKADAVVSAALVAAEVAPETKVTETLTVEVEAQVQARIRITHRQDIAKGRTLLMDLFEELRGQCTNQDLIVEVRDALANLEQTAEGKARLMDAWYQMAGLNSRAKTLKLLAESLRIVIDKEREAFGMEAKGGGPADGLPVVSIKDLTGRKTA